MSNLLYCLIAQLLHKDPFKNKCWDGRNKKRTLQLLVHTRIRHYRHQVRIIPFWRFITTPVTLLWKCIQKLHQQTVVTTFQIRLIFLIFFLSVLKRFESETEKLKWKWNRSQYRYHCNQQISGNSPAFFSSFGFDSRMDNFSLLSAWKYFNESLFWLNWCPNSMFSVDPTMH